MDKKTRDYFAKLNPDGESPPAILSELPPAVFDIVPGYPGLIYREQALAEQMELRIPRWEDYSSDPALPDIVYVFIKPVDDAEYEGPFLTFEHNFDATLPELFVTTNIARGRRPPGHWDIKYEVYIRRVPNLSESFSTRLIVDTEAPYAKSPILFPPPPIVPAGVTLPIDEADFPAAPNDRLFLSIPDYVADGREPGDTIRAFYNDSDTPYAVDTASSDVDWPVTDLRFPLPKSVVEAGPDGYVAIRYQLLDAARNPSQLSSALRLDVALLSAPTNLKQPLIGRAFPGDNLFDRVDASIDQGMIVRISEYQHFERGNDGDIFDLTLSTSIATETIPGTSLGSTSFPVPITVPIHILQRLYGASTGDLPLTVTYVVRRRSVTYPAAPSTVINLNLHVVGPAPTNPPDLTNADLYPVVIKGVDAGGVEGNDNELLPAHANRPANAHITLWDASPTPDAEDFVIRLYYEGDLVATRPITGGVAGDPVTPPLQIPWAIIAKHGNAPPLKQVYYTIGTATGTNRQESEVTSVDVQANVQSLAMPEVRNLELIGGPPGVINCNTVRPLNANGNITVFIPPSRFFEEFMVVRVDWKGYSDNTGTTEVPAAAGFTNSPALTPLMISQGFEVTLGPFSTIMKLIQPHQGTRLMGAARINYTIQLPTGPLTSSDALHLSRSIKSGASPTYCDNTPVPAAP
ncbi:hypothetical protein [Pseudomonas lactis]|uniref:hypothetical protein n=1 Tax=Pseudomonas lactis TaxID=1615674 RepID=UPI0022C6389F|nr:hypothetical protein [Pseudomonas lactis]GLH49354.1 hypothetical protein RS3R2_30390 [Pseudomonas lactis]